MSTHKANEIHLINRPSGLPSHADVEMVQRQLEPPVSGQVLIKNIYMSVDPYMRGRMRENAVYAQAYQLNEPMYGGAIGEVIESNSERVKAGEFVLNQGAWRDSLVADDTAVTVLQPFDKARLSLYLGALGMPGLTAYVGLKKFGEPKAGETVFVSAASGAVGAIVCQIAKQLGCRVIGSVGDDMKAEWLKTHCGVDATINYKTCGNLTKAVAEAAPEGIDVYFENVGGEHLQAALNVMNPFGRVAACGMISAYNDVQPGPGPNNLMLIVGKKIRITGFIVSDHTEMQPQFLSDMVGWIKEGKIEYQETVYEGLGKALDAFLALFSGENFGKMIVKL
ncbi:MAG TPA: NADP-dependent oxidoreductase [Gammaproteobacteria bacterium]|nr:NADP-dependent oxidoreductase [Gammaproteobacteria bacterium]